ncbi:hypothetical protein J6X96_03555 [bacterium]|nr:hypothetical protein [bacterium]
MTHLKTLISIILFLASAGTLLSFANDGTSLTISGNSTIYNFVTRTYEASASNGEITSCRWSQSDPVSNAYVDVTPRGNQCDVTFRSYGGITLNCDADIKLNETPKQASDSKIIRCFPPPINGDPSIDIEGPNEVTVNSSKIYNAIHHGTKDTPSFTWRYHGQTRSGESTEIHFVTNGTVRLECTMSYKDDNNEDQSLSDDMDIHVLPQVELSAMRADYKNYTNAIISGTNDIYIHFNIDDDDKSYNNEDKRGTDCKQIEFANGGLDDDLCKIELSLGANIDPEKITNGTLIFETSEGLRLWKSTYRTQFILEQNQTTGLSFSDPEGKAEIIRILRDGFYVEGVLPGQHCLTIRLADKELILPYVCCSVGGINDQPIGSLRASYKTDYPDLIDCEWCVKEITNNSHPQKFNCIAYAVDPNLVVFNKPNLINSFNGAFWVSSKYEKPEDKQFDEQNYLAGNDEPFLIEARFHKDILAYFDPFVMPGLTLCYQYVFNGAEYTVKGYDNSFKQQIKWIIENENLGKNCLAFEKYLTTMNFFNCNGIANEKDNFTLSDVDALFTLPLWSQSQGNQLQECNVNNSARKIIYYHGKDNPDIQFHAARMLNCTQGCEKLGESTDPTWNVAIGKAGKSEELLVHRVEQISSKHGSVMKAYK